MQFSLRSLVLAISTVCVVLAWCSYFELRYKDLVPLSTLGIIGAIASLASLVWVRGVHQLALAASAELLLIVDAVWWLYSIYLVRTHQSLPRILDELVYSSAVLVVAPALAVIPFARSVYSTRLARGSRAMIWTVAIAWILLLVHFQAAIRLAPYSFPLEDTWY